MMLQTFLNSQGAGLRLTGDFDEATEAAVRAFQETAGIPQHGVVGTETIQSMLDTWQQPLPKPRPEPTPPPLPKPNPLRPDPSAAFQPAPGFAQSPAMQVSMPMRVIGEVPRPGPVAGSAGIPAATPGFGQAIGAVPGWAELAAGAGGLPAQNAGPVQRGARGVSAEGGLRHAGFWRICVADREHAGEAAGHKLSAPGSARHSIIVG